MNNKVFVLCNSSSTAGVQWLQQGNPGHTGAAAERAQRWVAAWELLPGRHHAQTERLWPQQGDGQVVQANGRPLLLTPTCLLLKLGTAPPLQTKAAQIIQEMQPIRPYLKTTFSECSLEMKHYVWVSLWHHHIWDIGRDVSNTPNGPFPSNKWCCK